MNMHKSLLLSIICIWSFWANASICNGQIIWKQFESVQQSVKVEPKPIFIEFTAEWCGWCKKMNKTTFVDNRVVEVLNNDFYAVRIDFDSTAPIMYNGHNYTGKELAKKFGIAGLPTMICLPPGLTSIDKIIGYKSPKQLLRNLNQLKYLE